MKESTRASFPPTPTAPASDETRRSAAGFGLFPAARAEQTHSKRLNSLVVLRHRKHPDVSSIIYRLPSIPGGVWHFFSVLRLPMISAATLTTEEVARTTSTDALAETRPSEGSVRSCSPRSLGAESHLGAPLRLPTQGCCRRLSLSAAAAAAVTAAPDHIKLSYSSNNNFRLLHSGPTYSQQWLWEAPGEAEDELSGDDDEKQ